MKRTHTYASIAREKGKEKRTVQLWAAKAKADGHELGAMVDGSRKFSDEEKVLLLSYGSDVSPEEFIEQEEEIQVVEHTEIQLLGTFSPAAAIAKFDGAVGAATDPDQILLVAKAVLDASKSALVNKTEQQRQELARHQQALSQLREMTVEGITDLKIAASESRMLATKQDEATVELHRLLGKLTDLGKVQDSGQSSS